MKLSIEISELNLAQIRDYLQYEYDVTTTNPPELILEALSIACGDITSLTENIIIKQV